MRRKQNVKRLSLVFLVMTATAAQAAPFDITDAWFRALPGKLPAGGYFTAQNNGHRDISITSVSSDSCGMLMMHQSSSKGGMTGMDMVDSVKVPAGGAVKFAPGGYHLMCDSPKMKIGAKVPVLLHLSDGSTVAVGFQVRNAAGK
jgi:copper(I)-binding protein